MTSKSRFRFTTKTLLILVTVMSVFAFIFANEYEFRTVRSSGESLSPDGKYRVEIEFIEFSSLVRRYAAVQVKVFHGRGEQPVAFFDHSIGKPHTESVAPPEFVDDNSIKWNITKLHNCTYPITAKEEVTVSLGGNSLQTSEVSLIGLE